MKTLYLLRHAEAQAAVEGMEDRARPLTQAGTQDAARVGAYMRARRIFPDYVLCSPALRTRQTAAAVESALGRNWRVDYDGRIYNASPEMLLAALSDVPEEAESALVITHNPGIHQLSLLLAGAAEQGLRDALSSRFPTAGLAEIVLPVAAWESIGTMARGRNGTLTRFAAPSGLEAAAG